MLVVHLVVNCPPRFFTRTTDMSILIRKALTDILNGDVRIMFLFLLGQSSKALQVFCEPGLWIASLDPEIGLIPMMF